MQQMSDDAADVSKDVKKQNLKFTKEEKVIVQKNSRKGKTLQNKNCILKEREEIDLTQQKQIN